MQVLGIKRVKIDALKLPGNWHKLVASEETGRRARSIDREGLIHEPLVRKSDMRVVAGRQRIAAYASLGREEIEVKFIEATDHECARLEIAENLERRQYESGEINKLTKQLVDLCEMEETETPVPPPKRGPGRPRTPRSPARERVAQQRNVKPESVRKAEQRAKAAEQAAAAESELAANEPLRSPIDLLGMAVDDQFIAQVTLVCQLVTDAMRHAKASQACLSHLANSDMAPIQTGALDVVREKVADAIDRIKGHVPKMLCPSCKGIEVLVANCVSCHGTAYVTESQLDFIPKELLDPDDPKVLVGRKFEPLSKYLPDEPPAEEQVDWFGEDGTEDWSQGE
jgi:hypothetical protein